MQNLKIPNIYFQPKIVPSHWWREGWDPCRLVCVCSQKYVCDICSSDSLRTSVLRECGVGCYDMEMVVSALFLCTELSAFLRTSHWHLCWRRISETV